MLVNEIEIFLKKKKSVNKVVSTIKIFVNMEKKKVS